MRRTPFSFFLSRFHIFLVFSAVALSGCAAKQIEDPGKYQGDTDEMMTMYTPRDDGLPLTAAELRAFKTVSDLDRYLSEEDARIVELHFKFFVHQRRGTFERFVARSSRFLPHIKKTFTDRGIPADIAFLCMVESGGNPNARSPAGAAGLWQFIPATGRKYGLIQNAWIDERRDPYKATYAASDYLLKLYGDFGNWHLAVAAYNAGEGKIGRAVNGTGARDFFELCRLDGCLEERARLKEETRDYVPRLIAVAKIMRNLSRLGFSEPTPAMAWDLKPLTVPPGTNLTALANRLGLSWEEFSGMNPAFRRASSPPNMESTAYVPPEKLADAVNFVASREARSSVEGRDYTVRKGDTLTSIAKRHKVSVSALKEANGFDRLPPVGSVIIVPGKGPSPAGGGISGSNYTVRPGDTLSGLARQWGVGVSAIRIENGMGPNETTLRPGQRMRIPGAAPAPRPRKAAASDAVSGAGGSGADGSGAQYTVQPGDTVFAIARKLGLSVDDLCSANNLNRSKPAIKAGQTLFVPGAKASGGLSSPRTEARPAPAVSASGDGGAGQKPAERGAAPAKARNVTVRAGDTLYGIARAQGVSVSALQKANNLKNGAKLKTGQRLRIP